MTDAVRIFAEHAVGYHALRRRLVPELDAFYGTAVDLLALRPGPVRRVLDLGAGTAQRRLCGRGLFLQALALRRDRGLAAAGRGGAERGLTARYRLTVKWTLFAALVEPFTPIVAA
jgi:hypothetical protein